MIGGGKLFSSLQSTLVCAATHPNSNITHYSYFGAFRSDVSNVGPNAAMLTEKGKLTDIGSWYLGGTATNNVPRKGAANQVAKFASWSVAVMAACVCVVL